ncbi:MAG: carboxypeptidase-like regulatory domain-containing protein [Cyclobacteriaceae bacterium]|nr:carboxypeptidase-like regulatory domain-containing protein [Cyclobacteriaceae bacterium]
MMRYIFTILFAGVLIQAYAGGIRGVIKGDDVGPLAFASIFVKQTGTGSATDMEGRYEVHLKPGRYDVVFQYLGYESVNRVVEVGDDFVEINLTLKTQVVVLQTVTVKAGKEDPAYTIMRKAIAKAKFHTQQIDAYSATVYIKGKGQLTDYPWLAKKALEKEGITKDRVFISESVSEIKYTRPNKFEEKVIAVYTNGDNKNTSPNSYIFGSFYQPEIAETVSPLSPKAFSYYRFEYLGSFKDQGYEVSKIKVTPRSRGDNVFEGLIHIVEDWWSIHSLELNAIKLGISFHIKQLYNPIEDKAWLPVSQQFQVKGKVFGFEFEGQYLATMKDYRITLNPELQVELTVIDEKIYKEEAKAIEQKFSKKGQEINERLTAGKEVTGKELRQLVKEYEKQEAKEQKEPEVISETKYSVDSLAYKKDSTFWVEIRPTPLTKEEERGYHLNDSLTEVQRKRDEGDTLRNNKNRGKGFQPWDLLTGDSYAMGKTSDFRIHAPYGGFNSVEGSNLIYRLSFYKRWVKRDSLNKDKRPQTSRLEISPIARYAFAREKISGKLRIDYRFKNKRLTLEGGRYVEQFNQAEPIHPFVNTFTSLLLGDNLMKIYEHNFASLNYTQRIDDRYTIRTNWTWSRRLELFNTTDYTFFKRNKEQYTPNAPVSFELPDTGFEPNRAFIGTVSVNARPWQKYRIRNGNKQRVDNSSPLLSLSFRKGFDGVAGSEVSFNQLELGLKHGIRFGIRGELDIALQAGKFFDTQNMYFMDYKHFLGNQTPFVTTDPVGSYRLMDYYKYSTADQYFTANAHYHFRKLLLTRVAKVRMVGITENVFVNYLATPTSRNYTEVGYGIEGILRIFRLEAAAAFRDGQYQSNGFRVGIATSVTINFND